MVYKNAINFVGIFTLILMKKLYIPQDSLSAGRETNENKKQ